VSLYRAQSTEDQAELQTPQEPVFVPEPAPSALENVDIAPVNTELWQPNPLLYWVLAPLAPLLWLVLRRRRKAALATKSQEGKTEV
jgi:hypothetical protein